MRRQVRKALVYSVLCRCGALPVRAQVDATVFRADLQADLAAADQAQTAIIRGKDGWLFFADELKHLGVTTAFWGEQAATVSHVANPEARNPLAAILGFQAQLESRGIELLMVPVPAKAPIYPEALSATVPAAAD